MIQAQQLPAGLAEPLHILEPADLPVGWLVLLGLLALGACWWWWLRRRQAHMPEASEPPAPTPPERDGILAVLDQLRQRHLASEDFRAGCHALAATARQQLDRWGRPAGGLPATSATTGELERFFGDKPLTRFLALLSDLQFGRPEPSRSDFIGACEMASAVLSKGALEDLRR